MCCSSGPLGSGAETEAGVRAGDWGQRLQEVTEKEAGWGQGLSPHGV